MPTTLTATNERLTKTWATIFTHRTDNRMTLYFAIHTLKGLFQRPSLSLSTTVHFGVNPIIILSAKTNG